MKIQRKFTTAARGMMAMKKDVAKEWGQAESLLC